MGEAVARGALMVLQGLMRRQEGENGLWGVGITLASSFAGAVVLLCMVIYSEAFVLHLQYGDLVFVALLCSGEPVHRPLGHPHGAGRVVDCQLLLPDTGFHAVKLCQLLLRHRQVIFVMLGLYAGLRREEICGLRWSDIDLDAAPPRLTVSNAVRFEANKAVFPSPLKSRAAHRTIPLPQNLADALLEEKRKSNSVFIIHDRDGHYVSLQVLQNIVAIINRRAPKTERQLAKRIAKEKELGRPIRAPYLPHDFKKIDFRPTPHILRHTYITRLIEAGMNVKQVQYLAGHDDVRMTLAWFISLLRLRPLASAI